MLEAKLWHIKTETKNVKVAKICDQYPRGFNFGDFFQLYNNFEIGDRGTSVHLDQRLKKISCRTCLLFYYFFDDKNCL